MFNLSLTGVINKIVEQELVGKGRDGEALHLHLDLRMAYYTKTGGEYDTSRGLHLLYYVPDCASYISVFSAVTLSCFTKVKDVFDWKHEVTHDSCWRDISTINDLYFQMARQVIASLGDKGKDLAPKDMTEHNSFALFGNLYDWVPVEVKKDYTDPHSYRKSIVLLK